MSFDGSETTTHISVGPWGGSNGARWDDGVYSTVRQMVIGHGAGIDSIQIEYVKRGASVWSDKHGGSGGIKTDRIKLSYPDEFLVSISGHYGPFVQFGPVLVRSLMFESNRKKYGPFGIQQGTPFSFPMTGGKVVGFHGRSSWYLDSVGVYLRPLLQPNVSNNQAVFQNNVGNRINDKIRGDDIVVAREKEENVFRSKYSFNDEARGSLNPRHAVSYGPWGGNGGMLFDDGVYTGVQEIHLTRYGNGGFVWIRVCYDMNGQTIWGNKNGGSGGIKLDKISFDYPSEVLTHISGYYGSTILRGPTVVKSLTFHTNKRKYGPFGEEQGISFSSGSYNGIIVGFHGRKGWFVDSIGVHVLEGKPPLPQPAYAAFNEYGQQVVPGMMKEAVPWGGDGGKPWDDGIFSGIKKIFLAKGEEAIYAIQIEYDRNGQSVWSVRHGGGSDGSSHMIKLEYPYEILTGISGYYGTGDESSKVIKSLTFYSNKGKYGPFGEEFGTFFCTTKNEGKIVGFHGRSGCYLNAIGVHTQPYDGGAPAQQGLVKTILDKLFY